MGWGTASTSTPKDGGQPQESGWGVAHTPAQPDDLVNAEAPIVDPAELAIEPEVTEAQLPDVQPAPEVESSESTGAMQ